ncbi:hypothetical protein [uncultured Mediterranean phage]|nr:hypothetical protein [uncultured Mediterranean phage]
MLPVNSTVKDPSPDTLSTDSSSKPTFEIFGIVKLSPVGGEV